MGEREREGYIVALHVHPQVGGNSRAKDFFSSQPDISPGISLSDKYNSRAAALYRDKVSWVDTSETFWWMWQFTLPSGISWRKS